MAEIDLDHISVPPSLSDFIPVNEYQSQTPETFIGGRPVLHLYVQNSRIVLQNPSSVRAFGFLRSPDSAAVSRQSPPTNGHVNGNVAGQGSQEQHPDVALDNLDIYVGTDYLYIFNTILKKGVRLSYPSIGLHALATLSGPASDGETQTKVVYMQLNLYDVANSNSDDDVLTADVAIIPVPPPSSSSTSAPSASESASASDLEPHSTTSNLSPDVATQALYDAISACQDEHPDPMSEDEDGSVGFTGGIGTAGMPGDGGWITSENMAQFTDGDGNFVGFAGEAGDGDGVISLGPGAGTVRPRADADDDQRADGAEGGGREAELNEEAKRARID